MINIAEKSDLDNLEYSLLQRISELTSRIQALERQLSADKYHVVSQQITKVRKFKSLDELKQYVHDKIMLSNIRNLTEEECQNLLTIDRGRYIYHIIYEYSIPEHANDVEHLKASMSSKRKSKVENWIDDPVFYKIFYTSLDNYINSYLRVRYADMNKLERGRKAAEKMREASGQSEAQPSFSEQEASASGIMQVEFDKRLKAAIRRYNAGHHSKEMNLHNLIDFTMKSVFTPNEAVEAHWNYRRLFSGRKADSTLTAIGYKPEFAERFMKAFEEAVISEISK